MTGNSTEKRPYSPWILASASASYPEDLRSESAVSADPAGTSGLVLSAKERHALMAAYLIGRRQGSAVRYGALGQLAQRLTPNGALQQLAEAYVAAGEGRMEMAASRLQSLPMPARADASKRDDGVARLKALGRLSTGKRRT